jgi:5'-nucleotidase
MEGLLLKVPSIAISLVPGGDFAEAGRAARLVVTRVLAEGLSPKTLLNVNVPAERPRGVRVTRLGHRVYTGQVVEQADPRGRTHYWIGGGEPSWELLEGSDMEAINEGLVSVTPVHLDLTSHRALAEMRDWSATLTTQLRRDGDRRR